MTQHVSCHVMTNHAATLIVTICLCQEIRMSLIYCVCLLLLLTHTKSPLCAFALESLSLPNPPLANAVNRPVT